MKAIELILIIGISTVSTFMCYLCIRDTRQLGVHYRESQNQETLIPEHQVVDVD